MTKGRWLTTILYPCMLLAVGAGQGQQAATDWTSSIEGVVVDGATGKALSGVGVNRRPTVSEMDSKWAELVAKGERHGEVDYESIRDLLQSTALTDADGRFRLEKVPAGRVEVWFGKSDYETRSFPYTLTAGQTARSAIVRLNPFLQGIIAGRVMDTQGRPAPCVEIRLLYQYENPNGRQELDVVPSVVKTDDRGQFRFRNVDPGRYLVAYAHSKGEICQSAPAPLNSSSTFRSSAERNPVGATEAQLEAARNRLNSLNGNRTQGAIKERPVALLYPGVGDESQAEWVQVTTGETPLNDVLLTGRIGLVRIHVTNPSGQSTENVRIGLQWLARHEAVAADQSAGVTVSITGGIRNFWPLAPGVYEIHAHRIETLERGFRVVSGSEVSKRFVFTGQDIDVDFALEKPRARLPIRLLPDELGRVADPRDLLHVKLCHAETLECLSTQPLSLINRDGSFRTVEAWPRESDGTLKLAEIPAGRYDLVAVDHAPPGYYVSSATQGTSDTLVSGVIVSDDSPALEIRMKPGTAVVHGKVRDGEGRVVHNALVSITPDGPLRESRLQSLRLKTRADQNGEFELVGIAPGNYRITAANRADFTSLRVTGGAKLEIVLKIDEPR